MQIPDPQFIFHMRITIEIVLAMLALGWKAVKKFINVAILLLPTVEERW